MRYLLSRFSGLLFCSMLMVVRLLSLDYARGFSFTIGDDAPQYSTENPYERENFDIREDSTAQVARAIRSSQEDGGDEVGITNQLLPLFGFSAQDDTITGYISTVINYFLGIAYIIAIVMIIYGFSSMFLSTDDASFTKAKKIAVAASIAIVVLVLSVYIARFIMQVYRTIQE